MTDVNAGSHLDMTGREAPSVSIPVRRPSDLPTDRNASYWPVLIFRLPLGVGLPLRNVKTIIGRSNVDPAMNGLN